MHSFPALVADIGATNARFALVEPTGVTSPRILRCVDYPSLEAAARVFVEQVGCDTWPADAAIAIAGPVNEDYVELTNHAWSFSVSALKDNLGLDRLQVINDFTAQALAVTQLGPTDVAQVGGGQAQPNKPIGILGPGTGLGVSGIVPGRERWTPLSGEGGHVTLCATNEREDQVIGRLRQRFSHVSAERTLSGMGLTNLYETLASIDGVDVRAREPHEVTDAAVGQQDPHCVEAVEMFCAMLGTIAGNLALTLGATGGIYIGGGIVPKLGPLFYQSDFRRQFEAKGRFASYLEDIPTFVITRDTPAFLGLKALLEMPE